MTPAEVARVLAKASAFDLRTVGEADVLAWHEVLADIDFADALKAVGKHYSEHTERLMPAHVRRIALEIDRERRRQEREAREQRELAAHAAAARDRSAETYALIAEVRSRLPDTNADVLRRPEWVEHDKARARAERAEPNPHYTGPPPDGHPTPAAA